MIRVWAFVLSRMRMDRGATMVEYALILITIMIVALAGAVLLGPTTEAKFDEVEACFQAVDSC